MNGICQGRGWLVSFAAAAVIVSSAAAQSSTNFTLHTKSGMALSVTMPPLPPSSPIDYFRHLLAMTPQQREAILAKKSPEVRQKILAKVNEYEALDPGERELRLRTTELRWYLLPLLQASPNDRVALLAQVPDNIRSVVQARLSLWEILPPNLQQEFFENEHVLIYFSDVNSTNGSGAKPSQEDQSRWNSLPEDQRKAMTAQFDQFFILSPVEKKKALGGLSVVERTQVQSAMQIFDQLPQPQRSQCIRAFVRYAAMGPQARAEFLKNAQQWSQMTPAQRKAWIDLTAHVPQWPPLPQSALMPPTPPTPRLPQSSRTVVTTNQS
jgi:hypothetical protein